MTCPDMGQPTEPRARGSAFSRDGFTALPPSAAAACCRSSTSTMRGTPLVSKNTSLRGPGWCQCIRARFMLSFACTACVVTASLPRVVCSEVTARPRTARFGTVESSQSGVGGLSCRKRLQCSASLQAGCPCGSDPCCGPLDLSMNTATDDQIPSPYARSGACYVRAAVRLQLCRTSCNKHLLSLSVCTCT